MLPWGHLAVGYFVYTVSVRVRGQRAPRGGPTLVLALGTQLPDLVDKPLNWWFGIFDGRGIAHSLLVIVPVCVIALSVAHAYERRESGIALSVGLLSHLFADSWQALLSGQFGQVTFLLWPLFPVPRYPKDSLFDHLAAWLLQIRTLPSDPVAFFTGRFGTQFVLLVVLVLIWALDGFPGVKTTWKFVMGRSDPAPPDR
jgi:hypothetical protein